MSFGYVYTVTGVRKGDNGEQFPGHRITMRVPKCPKNVTSTFFNTVNLLPKELRFQHGAAKLASCPGRHLTSLRLCIQWNPASSTTPSHHSIGRVSVAGVHRRSQGANGPCPQIFRKYSHYMLWEAFF